MRTIGMSQAVPKASQEVGYSDHNTQGNNSVPPAVKCVNQLLQRTWHSDALRSVLGCLGGHTRDSQRTRANPHLIVNAPL